MRRLCLVLALTLCPATALAESGVIPCESGTIYPETDHVPANLETFVLRSARLRTAAPEITFTQQVGGEELERELTITAAGDEWHLTPVLPLEPGNVYTFVDDSCSFSGAVTRSYTVDEAIEPATVLGVTEVSELRAYRRWPGGPLNFFVRVDLVVDERVGESARLYETTVFQNGMSFSGWGPLQSFSQSVNVGCIEDGVPDVLAQTYEHRARAYGAAPTLFTDPVDVVLRCADAVRVDPRSERPLTPEEIEAMDTPIMDGGGGGSLDGGIGPDGGMDVSGMEPIEGCSCRAAGSGPAPWPALAVFGLLLAWRRARRRG